MHLQHSAYNQTPQQVLRRRPTPRSRKLLLAQQLGRVDVKCAPHRACHRE
jgi:hypothetical protein